MKDFSIDELRLYASRLKQSIEALRRHIGEAKVKIADTEGRMASCEKEHERALKLLEEKMGVKL